MTLTNMFMICKEVRAVVNGPSKAQKEGMKNKGDKTNTEKDKKTTVTKTTESTEKKTSSPDAANDTEEEEKKCKEGETLKDGTCTKESESFTGYKNKGGNRIDYAATVEEAYDDLNKILGSDGIKNLTEDTKKLADQQKNLGEMMKNIRASCSTSEGDDE